MTVQDKQFSPLHGTWLAQASIGLSVLVVTFLATSQIWSTTSAVDPLKAVIDGRTSDSADTLSTAARLPLSFIPNAGQADPAVRFHVQGAGHTIFFTPSEVVFSARLPAKDQGTTRSVVRLRFVEANPNPTLSGLEPLPGTANFFLGNDPARWRTNLPTFGAVAYRELYPGIDLVYRGTQGRLKSEFLLAPRADPGLIRLAYSGVETLRLRHDGALVLQTPLGELIEEAPVAYQQIDGRPVGVAASYHLLGNGQVGFVLGAYNPAYPLLIDPTLTYSTYLGGNDLDSGNAIAVDGSGYAYVTGETESTNFPTTPGALQPTDIAGTDAFVTKLSADGSSLSYSTYLGGTAGDRGFGIAVDSSGYAYVTGETFSTDFPFTAGAFDTGHNGSNDAFVAKLDPTGSTLTYSTYLGGAGSDQGRAIAVDSSGIAFVTGLTASTDFPTPAGYDTTHNGSDDAFVTKLSADGSSLSYSTYLGGSSSDQGRAIGLDGSGYAYVTGQTESSNFPTQNAFQPALKGTRDAFVTKLDPTGTSLSYSTYLGGTSTDSGFGIAVGGSGNAYVTGETRSFNFPTQNPVQPTKAGFRDAFVTRFNTTGSALSYSTYLGGTFDDIGNAIAVNSLGNAFVTGQTSSINFPTVNPYQATRNGAAPDAFVTTLDASGSSFKYSTYLGGTNSDTGKGIAVDDSSNAYVTGQAGSSDFPTTAGAFQTAFQGGSNDAFVTRFPFTSTAVTLLSFSAHSSTRITALERVSAAFPHSLLIMLGGIGLITMGLTVALLRNLWPT